ncbi:uncharacterized protein MYCFIDRAFT_205223 [Pseudocercospora fijiensis CIRAD86]|uniref:Uncharacterized protein n=1 Tax=Pseudocercospora fijiensis (strain CIRAD86) TaxID=383855 RepID=M2ZZG9_PSEFD|nr:uncharacterized protein MYCFIDRAFT_205223 [Pseudocercospora fijiensis CIRAD86]EME77561.1 hypothetical protein MYCFIDRAFT_205223 [Pseudocercospora fijiensis CIRAD86]
MRSFRKHENVLHLQMACQKELGSRMTGKPVQSEDSCAPWEDGELSSFRQRKSGLMRLRRRSTGSLHCVHQRVPLRGVIPGCQYALHPRLCAATSCSRTNICIL